MTCKQQRNTLNIDPRSAHATAVHVVFIPVCRKYVYIDDETNQVTKTFQEVKHRQLCSFHSLKEHQDIELFLYFFLFHHYSDNVRKTKKMSWYSFKFKVRKTLSQSETLSLQLQPDHKTTRNAFFFFSFFFQSPQHYSEQRFSVFLPFSFHFVSLMLTVHKNIT